MTDKPSPDPNASAEKSWLGGLLSRIGRHELGLLVMLALVAVGTWAFVEVAELVEGGATRRFDKAILLAMRNPADRNDLYGPPWVEELGRDFTALGSVAVLAMLTGGVAGFLALSGKKHVAVFLGVAVTSGLLLSVLLKREYERPRPELVPHKAYVYTSSFPSGHAMLSAVTYLTLGALLARVQPRRRIKAYVLLLAVILTVLIGVSRVYLGVHWPTDVLSGWAAGTVWALVCWLVARWLQRRGKLEMGEREPS